MLICVVGDTTLDVTVVPTGPMAPAGDERARISLGPGGQGANVAVRLARAGLRVRLVTPLSGDAGGQVLRGHLAAESVEVAALPASRTSMVLVTVGLRGERTMLSDRVPADGGGNLAAALAGSDWVHVSGYLLRDAAEAGGVVTAIRASGIDAVSVAGGSFVGWTEAGVAREAVAATASRLLILNRDEAGLLASQPTRTAEEAAIVLGTPERLAVVTDGERGSAASGLSMARTLVVPVPASQPIVDTTGAGDAYAAALVRRLAPGWPPLADAVEAAMSEASAAGSAAAAAQGAQAWITGELPGGDAQDADYGLEAHR